MLFAVKCGLHVHKKLVPLLPNLMAGSLVMASALLQRGKHDDPLIIPGLRVSSARSASSEAMTRGYTRTNLSSFIAFSAPVETCYIFTVRKVKGAKKHFDI